MPDKPNQNNIGKEWFLRGDRDLESARLLFEQGGYTDTVAVLLQQAAKNTLKDTCSAGVGN